MMERRSNEEILKTTIFAKKFFMKTKIDELRVGNLVSYHGKLGNKSYVEIQDMKDSSDKKMFWFKKRFDFENEFVGYEHEIREIFLTESILKTLGFTQDSDRSYQLQGVTIKGFGSISGTDPLNLKYTDYGWYALPKDAIVNTYEDLKQYTNIRTLHALQNYLEDAGVNLDYKVLRW
jgi:hypothetical protein